MQSPLDRMSSSCGQSSRSSLVEIIILLDIVKTLPLRQLDEERILNATKNIIIEVVILLTDSKPSRELFIGGPEPLELDDIENSEEMLTDEVEVEEIVTFAEALLEDKRLKRLHVSWKMSHTSKSERSHMYLVFEFQMDSEVVVLAYPFPYNVLPG
jgi:hypothetical protein